MLTLTKTGFKTNSDFGETWDITSYAAQGVVECAGDSIWGDTNGRVVRVDGIRVKHITWEDGDTSTMVDVEHDTTWDIYTDSGFEAAISAALGFDVTFTEQGMQEDGYASMET